LTDGRETPASPMDPESIRPEKAYRDEAFLGGRNARPLRILSEYLHPAARLEAARVSDTIVFFGSSRLRARDEAEVALSQAREAGAGVAAAERALAMSRYYEDARELARRLTEWSKGLEQKRRRFVVCTGGGPGIMEAANRGASEAKGINVGLGIFLPHEESGNAYVTRSLAFEFHYFFMRKFWFVYLAKALVAFPGGFGTLDEFFEVLTLVQTRKLKKQVPVVLYGRPFWDTVINLEAMADFGTIDTEDVNLPFRCDTVDEAFDHITGELVAQALDRPGGRW